MQEGATFTYTEHANPKFDIYSKGGVVIVTEHLTMKT
jgi:hypothetical protein